MLNETKKIEEFQEDFLAFNIDSIEKRAADLLKSGIDSRELLSVSQRCIEAVGVKFENGEYYLPELVIAGEIFKIVSNVIKNNTTDAGTGKAIGKIVVGTPLGDIHSLGKDIFCVLAEAGGFLVYDLGVDVPPDVFIEKLKETQADILGMSALLTSTYAPMQEVITKLEEMGLRTKVFVTIGGSATTKDMVERLKVDAQSRDAYETIRTLKDYMAKKGV